MKIKQKLFVVSVLIVLITSFSFFHSCDMEYINPVFGNYEDANGAYLTILSLPKNTLKHHVSSVYLNNSVGIVAKCADYNDIVIIQEADSVTAKIPLVYYADNEVFRETGVYLISFALSGDINSQVIKTPDDNFAGSFFNGSGVVNFAVDFGYIQGGLTILDGDYIPVIKAGSVFELNGFYYAVDEDYYLDTVIFPRTCLVYVYLSVHLGKIQYEYSTIPPVYNIYKKGHYDESGTRRALFKFFYVADSPGKYFAITNVDDSFENLIYYTINDSPSSVRDLPVYYSLSGLGNPQPHSVSLPAGGYIFVLTGAGGGNSFFLGGNGGFLSEAVVLLKDTVFTLYTGQKGQSVSYTFSVVTKGGSIQSPPTAQPPSFNHGCAGGGSGTFIFSPDGYFICAGGGGGSGDLITSTNPSAYSVHLLQQQGCGGAGGSVGPGACGGTDNFYLSANYGVEYSSEPFPPGIGGGYGASVLSPSFVDVSGCSFGYSSYGGKAAYYDIQPPNDIFYDFYKSLQWINTNDANGEGGFQSKGQSGGNNRNSTRGGGSTESGSIMIYKVF